jgi:hypothetical protein
MARGTDPDSLSRIEAAFANRSTGGSEISYRRKDGSLFWSAILISPVRDEVNGPDRKNDCHWLIPLKKSAGVAKPCRSQLVTSRGFRLSRRSRLRHRDQLREFAEVLGSGCEMKLVTGAIRSSQA